MLGHAKSLSAASIAALFFTYGCSENHSSSESSLPTSASILAASCTGCHSSQNTDIPTIDTLETEAITAALQAYKSDPGNSVMHRIMRGYSDDEISELASYLGAKHE